MPPIGLAIGGVDFSNLFVVLKEGAADAAPYASLAEAKAAGAVTLNYGAFINTIITFLIIALAVFMLVRVVSRLHKQPSPPPPDTKSCPQCATAIPLAAKRCPNCTSQLAA